MKSPMKKAMFLTALGVGLMSGGDLTPDSWLAHADNHEDEAKGKDHRCGEGQCGGDKKMEKKKGKDMAEHKCGEGQCGGEKKKGSGHSCGEGSCG